MKNLRNIKNLGNNISNPNDKETYERYMREIAKLKPISKEEEQELFKRFEETQDESIIEKICKHNLLFVVSVAKTYSSQISSSSLTLEDLISEGNYGLCLAAKRFDYKTGNKFISYAVWWIRQAILTCIQNNVKSIRLPNNVRTEINKIKRVEMALEQKLGREPSTGEIFDVMLEEGLMTDKDSEFKIDELLKVSKFETSLNSFVGDEADCELGDLIQSDDLLPHEKLFVKERKMLAHEMLNKLNPREKRVLCSFFGLQNHDILTISEIAEREGVTSSSVRVWIDKALRRMRWKNKGGSQFFFPTPDYRYRKWGKLDGSTIFLI